MFKILYFSIMLVISLYLAYKIDVMNDLVRSKLG